MSNAAVPVDTPSRRFAGWAGLGFALLVLIQNGVLLVGVPLNDAPMDEILSFYTDNAGRITAATALVPINVVLLLTFVAGVTSWARERSDASLDWGRLGLGGAVLMASTFLLTTVLQIALVVLIDVGADSSIIELIWIVHAAAFALNMPGLAVTLAGLAQVSRVSALGPNWLNSVALAGALCLLIAAVFAKQTIDGSPVLFVGLAGFATWLVWVPVNSIILIRRQARSSEPHTSAGSSQRHPR